MTNPVYIKDQKLVAEFLGAHLTEEQFASYCNNTYTMDDLYGSKDDRPSNFESRMAIPGRPPKKVAAKDIAENMLLQLADREIIFKFSDPQNANFADKLLEHAQTCLDKEKRQFEIPSDYCHQIRADINATSTPPAP